MLYAQFHHMSTGYIQGSIPPRFDGEKKPIPACGSDAVQIIDGRYSIAHAAHIARQTCEIRGYVGFTIERGESFTRSTVVRAYEGVR